MPTLQFVPTNGLGDKLLDIIGMSVLCEIKSYAQSLVWINSGRRFAWGSSFYDADLFNFPFEITNAASPNYDTLVVPNACVSISPCVIAEKEGVAINTIVEMFVKHAQTLFRGIADKIPVPEELLQNNKTTIGIHLRKSDKIVRVASGFETSVDQFRSIMNMLSERIASEMVDGNSYFVCSEDKTHRDEFISFIKRFAKSRGFQNVTFVVPKDTMTTFDAVRDVLYLSKCCSIYQGIQYSTFSTVAAIAGQIPLVNFAVHDDTSLLHLYKDCIPQLECLSINQDSKCAGNVVKKWSTFSIEKANNK